MRWTARLEPLELLRWAGAARSRRFAGGGRQRAARAIEVALLTGQPLSLLAAGAREPRAAIDPWYVVLTVPRPVLHQRIARRAEEMVRRGLIEEVAAVLAEGHRADAPGLDGIGIREAVEYLHGQRPRESRWPRRSPSAPGSTPSGRRPGSGTSSRGPVLTLDATPAAGRSWPSEIAGCGEEQARDSRCQSQTR